MAIGLPEREKMLTRRVEPGQTGISLGWRPEQFGHSPRCRMPNDPWFVIEAEHKQQSTALKSLHSNGHEAYLATRLVMQRKRVKGIQGPPQPIYLPMFFQFLFARFDAERDEWPSRDNSKGVKRLLRGTGGRPSPVGASWVQALIDDEPDRNKLPDVRMNRFTMGQYVTPTAEAASKSIWTAQMAGEDLLVITCNGFHTTVQHGGMNIILARGDLELVTGG